VGETLSPATADLQAQVHAIGEQGDTRITVISEDGTVLADSDHDPATMENHATRPEVAAALTGAVGTDTRRSSTTGEDYLYVAAPVSDGRVIRAAVPLTDVRHQQNAIRLALLVGLLAAAASSIGGVLLVTRSASHPLRRMNEGVQQLGEGRLDVRVPTDGPQEVAALGATVNLMAERLAAALAASGEAQHTRDLILSTMDEGVLLFAEDGAVAFANPAMERHLGIIPVSETTLAPAAVRDAVTEARVTRGAVSVEVETGTPSRWLRGAAVEAEAAVLLVLRDVTDSRRLEAVRRDFVANASHELKTPAATIQATAETIRTVVEEDPAAVIRFADQLEREAIRLSRIVSDLLDLSRLESGSQERAGVALDEIVRDEIDRASEAARESELRIETQIEPASVRGSAGDLELLTRNLVDNAVRYSTVGGTVTVTLNEEDGTVVLRVEDIGVGIPSRDLDRIFERFYRVDRARSRQTGGTGLGLSIVRHVAENHGGTVEVESELGRGSTFIVRLPSAGPA
jgi:two-component system phosphate regulon sensor histidine kinase PhoR